MKRALSLVSLAVFLMGADKPKETNAPPVLKATATEVCRNYENAALGDDLYEGRTVEVTGGYGAVTNKLLLRGGRPHARYDVIVYAWRLGPHLTFIFNSNDRKELAALGRAPDGRDEPLPSVTIIGRCVGLRENSVMFDDCKIVAFKAPAERRSEAQRQDRRSEAQGQDQGRQAILSLSLREAQVQGTEAASPRLHEAQVQANRPYEYKVWDFDGSGSYAHTKEINTLAAEGWEYVGLVMPPTAQFGLRSEVLFKRLKK
jgi:hypothetical protein